MRKEEIQELIQKLKIKIKKKVDKESYNEALSMISLCANILYTTNIQYKDDELENHLSYISNKIVNTKNFKKGSNAIVFYDGFGLNDRGLAQIYLKALCKNYKIIYITNNRQSKKIPTLLRILEANKCKAVFLNKIKPVEKINELNDIIKHYFPGKFIFYSTPNDVVATTVMYAYEGLIERYQINLTDHAFWLGANCIDKCIEFRDYGATISNKYRGIDKSKIAVLPFYPNINTDYEFLGFPFDKRDEDFIIFSGGSIYKTISEDNLYYIMLEKLIIDNPQVKIWFASNSTCINLGKLIKKYPDRIYHTQERKDLYQLLEHVDLYLNTYPLIGGLMFQYSAAAGKIPLTLTKIKDFTDGFLLNQSNLNIVFDGVDDLLYEAKHIINDSKYRNSRNELMKQSVMTEDMFEKNLINIINVGQSKDYKEIDIKVDEFRKLYLDRMNTNTFNKSFVTRNAIKAAISCFPIRFMKGSISIIFERITNE